MRMLISTGFINFWKVIRAAKLLLNWSSCTRRGSKSLKSVSADEYIARQKNIKRYYAISSGLGKEFGVL